MERGRNGFSEPEDVWKRLRGRVTSSALAGCGGFGAMGSAFAVPCVDNSNQVFLVGSFLEDKVIEEIKSLKPDL